MEKTTSSATPFLLASLIASLKLHGTLQKPESESAAVVTVKVSAKAKDPPVIAESSAVLTVRESWRKWSFIFANCAD